MSLRSPSQKSCNRSCLLGLERSLNSLVSLYDISADGPVEQQFRADLENAEVRLGLNDREVAQRLNNLADLYRVKGNPVRAEPLLERALRILEATEPPDPVHTAALCNNRGNISVALGQLVAAKDWYARALDLLERAAGEEHPYMVVVLQNLAACLQVGGDAQQAETFHMRSICVIENQVGRNHRALVVTLNNLATLYGDQGRIQDAQALFQRALAIRENPLSGDDSDLARVRQNYADLLQRAIRTGAKHQSAPGAPNLPEAAATNLSAKDTH